MITPRRRLFIISIAFGILIFCVINWYSENVNRNVINRHPQPRVTHFNNKENTNVEGESGTKLTDPPDSKDLSNQWPLYESINQSFADIEVNGHSLRFNSEFIPHTPPSLIRIHIVFHSHVDPGWLRTFEEYYKEKTQAIISNAVAALKKYPKLKFIWSETSFLERWWRDATEQQKNDIKKQVKSGQLEISGGAWVMTDEATPTFYGAIENLIEGHAVIHELFDITPNTSWSVDPFGHGAMMPELLKLSGVEGMVIGRFHNHLKQALRERESLRWRWNAPYSQKSDGPRVNSLPHIVYTTEDACPAHDICMCYHVGPSALWQSRCKDGQLLSKMNKDNVEFMTNRFVEEMKKVQNVYGTDDILVPIGDDFFFADPQDFDQMYTGFAGMMKFLEENKDLNAEMRFSTVSDFFNAINGEDLADLRGDFFPYTSDMSTPNPWWTGYFVHRPYSKTMERRLQNSLRSLDIVSVLEKGEFTQWKSIRGAKRQLALFQHHDGITGTSQRHVMEDYEARMRLAFRIFQKLFAEGENNTLSMNPSVSLLQQLNVDETGEGYLTIFSSLPHSSTELISLFTDVPAQIYTEEGKQVKAVNVNGGEGNLLEFFADLNPLGFTVFKLKKGKSKVKSVFECMVLDEQNKVKAISVGGHDYPIDFIIQEATDFGGAYVMDSSDWKNLSPNETERLGGIVQRVKYYGYKHKGLEMTMTCISEGELEIEIQTDLQIGTTISLNLRSDVNNNDSFHTDVNAMYHLERRYQPMYELKKLPVDANFFPVASSVFIQDEQKRLTVLTGQPTGATSTESGSLTLLVDRRLTNDDGKGLGGMEGLDIRSSLVKYRVLLEERTPSPPSLAPYHSFRGYKSSASILYPPITVFSPEKLNRSLTPLPSKWPCGIQLVSWRPLSNSTAVLVLRHLVFEKSIPSKCEDNSPGSLFDFFSSRYKSMYHSKLSATVDGSPVTKETFLSSLKQPFSIATFRLHI